MTFVIDLGHYSTKVGISGETCLQVPSLAATPKINSLNTSYLPSHLLKLQQKFGSEAVKRSDLNSLRSVLTPREASLDWSQIEAFLKSSLF